MEPATRVQILPKGACVSLGTNTLGKGMNLYVPPTCYRLIAGQTWCGNWFKKSKTLNENQLST